jgi:HEAT repeat protein
MYMNRFLKQITLASALLAATVMAQTPYDEGQKALREQSWIEATEQFKRAIKTDKANADAAMYWRAYALYQANRKNEAERQIRSLERKFPESRWLKEAQVLEIEHQGADSIARRTTDENGLDEELRVFALAQLMDRDPQRALPLVLETIRNTQSEEIRNDALFVLGMSDEPEAQQAIADIARDSKNPELQANAIHLLGAASTESSLALLESLYTDSATHTVKEAIIHAHVAAGEPGALIKMLESEKNPQLQRDMIHALGAMGATAQLETLYPTFSDRKSRVAVLEAFAMAGDSKPLEQVLATESDPELRKTAIYGIAMNGDEDSAAYIESLYSKAPSKEEKVVILESLVMMDYAGNMALKIVRTESDPECG